MAWTRATHAISRGRPPVMASTTDVTTAAPAQPISWRVGKLPRARRAVVAAALPQWGGAISRTVSGSPDPSAPGVPTSSAPSGDGSTGGSDCCG